MKLPRIDRLLTLYLFYPLTRLKAGADGGHVTILMYHSISEAIENGVHPYFRTATSPRVFAGHMRFLHENGYRVIGLEEIDKHLADKVNSDKKNVVITFDDGFRDFYTNAFPVLKQYGFTATVFLPTSFISDERKSFKGFECLTWSEIRELYANGMTFGSHTATHPQLRFLNAGEVEQEVSGSKKAIEDNLGSSITAFSYPFAFPEDDSGFVLFLSKVLRASGYRTGVTTRIGSVAPGDETFMYKRIPVNSCDDPALLRAKLGNGYDWLSIPQCYYKKIKRMIFKKKSAHAWSTFA